MHGIMLRDEMNDETTRDGGPRAIRRGPFVPRILLNTYCQRLTHPLLPHHLR
jgi:hypothetical protein